MNKRIMVGLLSVVSFGGIFFFFFLRSGESEGERDKEVPVKRKRDGVELEKGGKYM